MTGEQLKIEGIERVRANNEEWSHRASEYIEWLSQRMAEFTADDLREYMLPPLPRHPNAYGAAFNAAAKAGIIRRVGYRKSTSPSAHSRVVSVWTKA